MSSLVLSDVAFAFPDDTTLFTGLDLAVGPGLTSLVGRNGAGKSTLLKLIAGDLAPSRGSISVDGTPSGPPAVAYLPQLLADAPRDRTLADELGVGERLAALERIEAGRGDDDDFDRLADDWSIAERTVAQLDLLGLPSELGRSVAHLSGGERTLAAIAGRLLERPRVLLLDEPTNNLDTRARGRLFAALEDFASGGDRIAVVVSHDLQLLGLAETTVELRAGRARVFGGDYVHYRGRRAGGGAAGVDRCAQRSACGEARQGRGSGRAGAARAVWPEDAGHQARAEDHHGGAQAGGAGVGGQVSGHP